MHTALFASKRRIIPGIIALLCTATACMQAEPDHDMLFSQQPMIPAERICAFIDTDTRHAYHSAAAAIITDGFHIIATDIKSGVLTGERSIPVDQRYHAAIAVTGSIVAAEPLPALHHHVITLNVLIKPNHILLLLKQDSLARNHTILRSDVIRNAVVYRDICEHIQHTIMLDKELV